MYNKEFEDFKLIMMKYARSMSASLEAEKENKYKYTPESMKEWNTETSNLRRKLIGDTRNAINNTLQGVKNDLTEAKRLKADCIDSNALSLLKLEIMSKEDFDTMAETYKHNETMTAIINKYSTEKYQTVIDRKMKALKDLESYCELLYLIERVSVPALIKDVVENYDNIHTFKTDVEILKAE